VRDASPRTQHPHAAEPGSNAQPGRHRKPRAGGRVIGLPLARAVGVAGALALIAGGTAAAATGSSAGSTVTTTLAAGPIDATAQDNVRMAAAARADRSRTDQAGSTADSTTAATTAAVRAAWLEKAAASQLELAQKLSAQVLVGNEVQLTAKTLAANRAAAATAAAAKARATSIGRYVLPVSSGVTRDTFGMTGVHWASRHTGQDFPVPLGTGVRAVSSGKVLETGWAGPFGNRMKLLLDDGTEIWYCHLSSYVVTSGRVSAGQIVALSGSTGNSTGPHLHMEVHLKQNPVASDPLYWLRSKGLSI
jgi:murein DD-endopeptidase MepM/ murein hydrolase activator NlpD